MPFMDGTGPLGEGPGSGRGRGMCAGPRRGFGRGNRRIGLAEVGRPELERHASRLERLLDRIEQQLSKLNEAGPSAQ